MVVLTNSRFISHRPERFEGRMPDHPVVSHVSVSNLCLVPWFHPRRVFLLDRLREFNEDRTEPLTVQEINLALMQAFAIGLLDQEPVIPGYNDHRFRR